MKKNENEMKKLIATFISIATSENFHILRKMYPPPAADSAEAGSKMSHISKFSDVALAMNVAINICVGPLK